MAAGSCCLAELSLTEKHKEIGMGIIPAAASPWLSLKGWGWPLWRSERRGGPTWRSLPTSSTIWIKKFPLQGTPSFSRTHLFSFSPQNFPQPLTSHAQGRLPPPPKRKTRNRRLSSSLRSAHFWLTLPSARLGGRARLSGRNTWR